jgi:hypothetical protein
MAVEEFTEVIVASHVTASEERFTPEFLVRSVSFGWRSDGQDSALSIQRSEGGGEDQDVCVVLTPSQLCAYNPFAHVALTRGGLSMRLNEEGSSVFEVSAVRVNFELNDEKFSAVRETLQWVFTQSRQFTCIESAA